MECRGRGDFGQLFAGLLRSQAVASPTGAPLMYSEDSIRIKLAGRRRGRARRVNRSAVIPID